MNEIELAKRLSNDEVLLLLKRSIHDANTAVTQLLIHIAEVDSRGLFRDEGHSSMFTYAVRALHMSEPEAALRIRAARLVRKFPQALEMVARGELHLTAICLLAPVLTADNAELLLGLSRRKSKFEVQELIAKRFPQPDVRSEIRKLPTPPHSAATRGTEPAAPRENVLIGGLNADPILQSPDAAPVAIAQVESARTLEPTPLPARQAPCVSVQVPLSEGRYKVTFTAGKKLRDKLEHAKALLRREVPTGELEAVFERALDLLIADREKKTFGMTAKPRRTQPKSASERRNARYVPHELRRAVYQRDKGECAFTATNGTRCGSRDRLEFHHIVAFALGGLMKPENIELRCRAHNILDAERDFGREKLAARIRARRDSTKPLRTEIAPPPQAAAALVAPSQHEELSLLQFPDTAQITINEQRATSASREARTPWAPQPQ